MEEGREGGEEEMIEEEVKKSIVCESAERSCRGDPALNEVRGEGGVEDRREGGAEVVGGGACVSHDQSSRLPAREEKVSVSPDTPPPFLPIPAPPSPFPPPFSGAPNASVTVSDVQPPSPCIDNAACPPPRPPPTSVRRLSMAVARRDSVFRAIFSNWEEDRVRRERRGRRTGRTTLQMV